MKNRLFGICAAGVFAGLPVGVLPSAADPVDHYSVYVELTLRPFVAASIADSAMPWDPDMVSDVSDAPTSEEIAESMTEDRAKIMVHSNDDYFLAVTVPETCDPDTDVNGNPYRHAKFGNGSAGDHMGGTFFLDKDVNSPQNGDEDITHWNGSAGHVVTEEQGAEQREWGLGVILHPGGDGDSRNPTCAGASGSGSGGLYSTTADLTVSLSP